ncbi:hypothetical protein BpHYR1_048622 [Brachionus plicatilis]|uniref:Uncharacterized protein n=1 Tax=Brachionus plicatilis TaxID=10195 RepID=A0A3M7RLN8_BRAPC|nr:hypothetical protein BpHYR1_048622 [Brachionus plicatilis]
MLYKEKQFKLLFIRSIHIDKLFYIISFFSSNTFNKTINRYCYKMLKFYKIGLIAFNCMLEKI